MLKGKIYLGCCVLVAILAVGFGTYKLTESPPTWMDEGIIIQVARNMALHGIHATQEAPGQFVSAGYVTTSFVVTAPIALMFKLFGVGLLQARLIMVAYLALLFGITYLLLRRQQPKLVPIFSLLLLATFAPLYGHGKNVLGEVPGVFFVLATLYLLIKIESSVKQNSNYYLLLGLVAGLAIVTKPIYLIFAPALALGLILLYRRDRLDIRRWVLVGVSFLTVMIAWVMIQFQGDTFSEIVSFYANPHSKDTISAVLVNGRKFLTEVQPLYHLLLLLVWSSAVVYRLAKKHLLETAEIVAFTFSWLITLAYLRTAGYYRYFFPGQILALVYLPLSTMVMMDAVLSRSRELARYLVGATLLLVCVGQFYQTMFNSWVADYYSSNRTAVVVAEIGSLSPDKSIFLYQVPEVATFLPTSNYYQYMVVTPTIIIGQSQLEVISRGEVDIIIASDHNPLDFPKYEKTRVFDRYALYELK